MPDAITDEEIGRIVLYSGLNFTNAEIADRVGVSKSTVSDHLNRVEDEAKASANPEQVAAEKLLAVWFGESFREGMAAKLS